MQNVDTAYVFTMVLPYIKIGDVGYKVSIVPSDLLSKGLIFIP